VNLGQGKYNMNKNNRSNRLCSVVFLALGVFAGSPSLAGPAEIIIVNINAPGIGFNDPTPAAPVGGNPGTTLGEQRLNAFRYAADLWSAKLDSAVPIRIRAQFTSLAAGVLGSAGPVSVSRDFANAPRAGTWYHIALANKLAGVDLIPATDDINTNFSTNFNFYLGLDNNAPPGQPDLVAVLLHEFAHGLGFSQFSNLNTGALFNGLPDSYNSQLLDTTLGLYWSQMTNVQRQASATRFGRVVWDGPIVAAALPSVLAFGSPDVRVLSPAGVAGAYQFGTAGFGPVIGSPNVTAPVVAALDAVEVTPTPGTATDGCSPFLNDVSGKIVLIERGLCGFAVKARNATVAGAVGVVIYNNAANLNAAPPGMADDGVNGAFVTIPTVSVRRVDGLAILGALAEGVTATISVDPTVRAGADPLDRARVYAPFPVVGGSSISHFDTVASPNLLMEPSINADLTHELRAPFDLSQELLRDVGWTFPDADGDGIPDYDDCNPNSDLRPTIVVGGINTNVPNTLFPGGCTSSDLLTQIQGSATNHGDFVAGAALLTNDWVRQGIITGRQKGAIENAVARSN
jgi:hypothetical protein